jgi:dTDP-4-amino-4,6-dideoxygalactose transaminase
MKNQEIPFFKPTIEKEEIEEVVNTLKTGWIGQGPKCEQFELNFRNYIGTDYAVSVSSCTAGLHLSLIALGIGRGDEVITTPLTFCSTANAIVHAGATPIFCDIEPKTLTIDPEKIEEKITQKTKAIIPVHLYGYPAEMTKILKIAKKYNLYVVEDAAHAVETVYHNQKIGAIGDTAVFSFYASKNITTGEGGMITTNNEAVAEKLKILRLHGLDKDAWKRYKAGQYKHYECVMPGYKFNMTDIQASLGIWQLKKVEKWRKMRKQIVQTYNELFNTLKEVQCVVRPGEDTPDNVVQAYHLFPIMVKNPHDRDHLLTYLQSNGVGVGVHFKPVHQYTYYQSILKNESYPIAENAGDRLLSLPLFPTLHQEDVKTVFEVVQNFFTSKKQIHLLNSNAQDTVKK